MGLPRNRAALGRVDQQITALIKSYRNGVTSNFIENELGLSHQTVSGNLRHLVERGIVRDSGNFGVTDSGRRAIRWEIVP